MKTASNKIETLFKRGISSSYKKLLYPILILFAGYNIYLKEFYIAGFMLFLMYILTYEKTVFFTETGMDTEYKTIFHHREKHTPFKEIQKVEIVSAPDVVLLNVYTNIFYQKIPISTVEYERLRKYFVKNGIPVIDKKKK